MSRCESVLFVGEAMLELVNKSQDLIAKSFAGDVYNTSVYLKRAFPTINVSYVSAVGQDSLSEEFLQLVNSENISTEFVARSSSRHLGAYMVINDEHGERSFIYWRNDSAAKSMMSSLSKTQLSNLLNESSNSSLIFFSGVTLAILNASERVLFWELLAKLKENGARIVFDPNYRPTLWESKEIAKQQIEKAFHESHWLMPGLDDFHSLYNLQSIEECLSFCEQFNYEELVLKQGAASVHVVNEAGHQEFEIIKSEKVVDTTSAGDAFNGIYLGARLQGCEPKQATSLANFAAAKVIETPGAIMPKALFSEYWQAKPMAISG